MCAWWSGPERAGGCCDLVGRQLSVGDSVHSRTLGLVGGVGVARPEAVLCPRPRVPPEAPWEAVSEEEVPVGSLVCVRMQLAPGLQGTHRPRCR